MPTPPFPVLLRSGQQRLKELLTRLLEHLTPQRRGLSWSALIGGGLATVFALWPLAVTFWDLLGLTSGQAWRVALAGTGAGLLAAGVVGVNWRRASPVRLFWLILASWTVAAGTIAAMTGLAWLVLDTPDGNHPRN